MVSATALLVRRGALCRSCLLAYARNIAPAQRRDISTSWLRKTEEAKQQWDKQAKEIKEGTRRNLWDILEERGYVKDTAGPREMIRELMRIKRIGAYVGVDPTASSLHVGHLVPLMPLFWMYMHGYTAYMLLGGSTVKIGDPTDRLKDRDPISSADLAMNITKMHYQMKRLWSNVEHQARRYGYKKEWAWKRALVNNNTWWNSTPMLEVMKRAGAFMRIGPLLSRDTVKRKMTEGNGASFAEFSYPIMQGWDWWILYNKNRVQMQIGGSDQFGNIVTGIEVVKAIRDHEPDPAKKMPNGPFDDPVGFTVPLLTDSSGAKFGKSAGNAVWLDEYMTSTFDLYGYFVRQPDADVERLLKIFTFMPQEEIERIMAQQAEDPSKRVAQHALAYEVVTLAHGEDAAMNARMQHRMMYGKADETIQAATTTTKTAEGDGSEYVAPAGVPLTPNTAPRIDMKLPSSLILGKSIGRILYAAGLCGSAKEGHRLASQQGAYIGGMPGRKAGAGQAMNPAQLTWNPVKLWFPQETQKYLIDDKILILRRGKHNVRVIEVVSDEEYERSGLTYPGQPYKGRIRMMRECLAALKAGKMTAEEVRQAMQRPFEDEVDDDGKIIFPVEKHPLHSELEEQLKKLLKEAEKKEKGKGKANK
ncbi:hypothetical protein VTH06DRAFT_700 [Thermothelomyces fergusii]